MKKKLFTTIFTAALATVVSAPVIAATVSDVNPDSSKEVTAKVVGDVNYTITIPEKVDFGTLTKPESNDDNYKFANFQVEATELNIFSDQVVSIDIKDSSSSDNRFYITQQNEANPFKLSYNVYSGVVNDDNIVANTSINSSVTPGNNGYHLRTFTYDETGKTQDVTLALNQNVLYNKTLSDIAGDYSGTITFHSEIITISN